MLCPRRDESHFGSNPRFARDDDYDPTDDSCHYCGSLAPDTFMSRCEAGDIELGPTDKGYKVYVENKGGAPFKQTYKKPEVEKRKCCECGHEAEVLKTVTEETNHTKFYFRHLSEEQMARFTQLHKERLLKFAYPGRFYVLPFFFRGRDHD